MVQHPSFCTQCGAKLPETAQFCTRCGTRVKPSRGSALPAGHPPEGSRPEPSHPVGNTAMNASPPRREEGVPPPIGRTPPPIPPPAANKSSEFHYVAFNKAGAKVTGSITAANRNEAIRAVQQLGYFLTGMTEHPVPPAAHSGRASGSAALPMRLGSLPAAAGRDLLVSIGKTLFLFRGRIRRQTFWQAVICLYALGFLLGRVIASLAFKLCDTREGAGNLFLLLFFASMPIILWPALAVQVKRWHDLGKPGRWVLINFVPLIGLPWAWVEMGFFRGTAGANQYGKDPLLGIGERTVAQKVLLVVCTAIGFFASMIAGVVVAEIVHGRYSSMDEQFPTTMGVAVFGTVTCYFLAAFFFRPRKPSAILPATTGESFQNPPPPEGRAAGIDLSYGGWLAFFGVLLIYVGPILTFIRVLRSFTTLHRVRGYDGSALALLENVGYLGISIFGLAAGLMLRRLKPEAIRAARLYLVALLLWSVAAAAFPYYCEFPGCLPRYRTHAAFDQMLSAIITLAYVVPWLAYLATSKRVKAVYGVDSRGHL